MTTWRWASTRWAGTGCISVTANVAPRLCADFQNAAFQAIGRRRLDTPGQALPAPRRALHRRLARPGQICARPRPPRFRLRPAPADDAALRGERRAVDAALDHAGLPDCRPNAALSDGLYGDDALGFRRLAPVAIVGGAIADSRWHRCFRLVPGSARGALIGYPLILRALRAALPDGHGRYACALRRRASSSDISRGASPVRSGWSSFEAGGFERPRTRYGAMRFGTRRPRRFGAACRWSEFQGIRTSSLYSASDVALVRGRGDDRERASNNGWAPLMALPTATEVVSRPDGGSGRNAGPVRPVGAMARRGRAANWRAAPSF